MSFWKKCNEKWRDVIMLGVIMIITSLLYSPVRNFGYSYFDDDLLLINRERKLLKDSAWTEAFKTDAFSFLSGKPTFYRPLLTWTFIIDAKIARQYKFDLAKVSHVANVLYHLLALISIFYLLKAVGLTFWERALASLLIGIHPALQMAVAWIPGRNDSLATIFICWSVYNFIKWLEKGESRFPTWSIICFGLAMFIKESAVLIIPICLLINYQREKKLERKQLTWPIVFWAGIFIFWGMLKKQAFMGFVSINAFERIIAAVANVSGLVLYLGKCLMPIGLALVPIARNSNMLWGLGVMVFLVANKKKIMKDKLYQLGLIWFVLFILPAAIGADSRQQYHAFLEHRLYTPIIGMAIAVVVLIRNWKKKSKKLWLPIFLMFWIGWFLFAGYERLDSFKNGETFWINAVEKSPNLAFAHANLGVIFRLENKFDEAEKYLKLALEKYPSGQYTRDELADVYFIMGKYDEAEKYILDELSMFHYDNAFYTLGIIYEKQGRVEEAIQAWQKTWDLNHEHPEANALLTQVYYHVGDLGKGMKFYLFCKENDFLLPKTISTAYEEFIKISK